MSDLTNIIKKEVRELLSVKTILPIIVLTLMFGFIGQSVGDISETAEEKPVVGIIDGDDSALSRKVVEIFENNAEIVFLSSDSSDSQRALEKLKEGEGVALLTIPSGFSDNIRDNLSGNIDVQWVIRGVGIMESIPTGTVNGLIQAASQSISKTLIEDLGQLDPSLTLQPVTISQSTTMRGRYFEGVSPGQIGEAMSSQSTLVPVIIMIIIFISGGQVIQSMGMEKGNKTLETLLTLPVKRSHVAIGKIVGSAIVGLVMAGIYMVGFGYYMQAFQPGGVDLAAAGLQFGMVDYALLGLSIFLTILAGLSICMLLGAFAEDYKSAQMRMFPLIILVFIPFFLSMFKSFYTLPLVLKAVLFVIPFSHPMISVSFLMFNDYLFVVAGVIYVAAFTGGIMALVSYIFKSDTLLTGRFEVKWLDRILKLISKRK